MPGPISKYAPLLRRRRAGKTDYRKRKAAILSRLPLTIIRASAKNIAVQLNRIQPAGDVTLAAAHSRELARYGWKGSRKNLPAAYLTGLLASLRGKKKGVQEAVVYVGAASYVHGSRVTAAVKGIVDGGIQVKVNPETFPSPARLRGEHVAQYAKLLFEKDKSRYKTLFSQQLAAGFRPETYPEHFEQVKVRIMGTSEERVKGK